MDVEQVDNGADEEVEVVKEVVGKRELVDREGEGALSGQG